MKSYAPYALAILASLAPFTATAQEHAVHMMMAPTTVSGSAEIENGNIDAGIRKSLRATQSLSASRRAAAYANLCIGYAKQADYANALSYCDKGVEENRFTAIARVNRGAVHYMMGNYTNSVADLERALALNNTTKEAKKNLARAERSYASLQQNRQNLAEAPQK